MRSTKSSDAITWLVEQGKTMFTRRFMGTVTALAAAAALVVVAPASAEGVTPAQLQTQGWACFVPPNLPDTIVCGNPAHGLRARAAGPERACFVAASCSSAWTAPFRATVHMIRADLLQRQPVPPNGSLYLLNPLNRLLPVRGLDARSGRGMYEPRLVPRSGSRDSGQRMTHELVTSRRGGRVGRAAYRASLGTALALLAVSLAAAGGAASATAGALETVTIAVIPVEPAAQAAYAKDRGLFRKHGIDAKLLVLGDPNAIAAAIASGDAQFAVFNIGGLALAKSRGFPAKLVAAGALYRPKAPTAALVSAPGKHITSARGPRREARRYQSAQHDRARGSVEVAEGTRRSRGRRHVLRELIHADARSVDTRGDRRGRPPRAVSHHRDPTGREGSSPPSSGPSARRTVSPRAGLRAGTSIRGSRRALGTRSRPQASGRIRGRTGRRAVPSSPGMHRSSRWC